MQVQQEVGLRERFLRFVGEQVAVRVDQLAEYLGLTVEEALGLAKEYELGGLVGFREVFVGEPVWLTLRERGSKAVGFRHVPFKLRMMNHRYFCAQVRLQLEQGGVGGKWISERYRRVRWPGSWEGELPDGVFVVGDARFAVEVQLSNRTAVEFESIIRRHLDRYDGVLYFCYGGAFVAVEEAARCVGSDAVVVKELAGELLHLKGVGGGGGGGVRVEPVDVEVDLLCVVSEMGAVAVAELGQLLGCEYGELRERCEEMERRGFLRSRCDVVGEDMWVWCSQRGARLCGLGVKHLLTAPGPWLFERFRALALLRVRVERSGSGASWVSGRVLSMVMGGRRGGVPDAVIEVGGERHAVHFVGGSKEKGAYRGRFREWADEFDCVVCVGSGVARRKAATVAHELGVEHVQFVDLEGKAASSQPWVAGVVGKRRESARRGELSAVELRVLRLFAEEGLLGVAEVAELLGCSGEDAGVIVESLVKWRVVRHGCVDGYGVELFCCTVGGSRVVGDGLDVLGCTVVVKGEERRALVRARVEYQGAITDAQWLSKHVVALEGGCVSGWVEKGVVVDGNGRRRVVELSLRPPGSWAKFMGRLRGWLDVYDGVVLFCSEFTVRKVEGLVRDGKLVGVEVRVLAGVVDDGVAVGEVERGVLRVVAEEGFLSVGEVECLVGGVSGSVVDAVGELIESGFLRWRRGTGGVEWLVCTPSGIRESGVSVSVFREFPDGLSERNALLAVRRAAAADLDGAVWVSKRVCAAGKGRTRRLLEKGVIEVAGERFVVDLCLREKRGWAWWRRKLERWLAMYDGVVVWCDAVVGPVVVERVREWGLDSVEVWWDGQKVEC